MNLADHGITAAVHSYWNERTLGTQYVRDSDIPVGSAEFFDHIRPWMNPYKFPEIMPRIDREARWLAGGHLLEVGCGMGFDSVEFLKRGVKVTATDLTPAAVELAKQHFDALGLSPECVQVANVLDLPFPEESFDAVWACGVLHHTGDTEKAINEIYRVLKQGGRAIISHFYRRPSWMYAIKRFGKENIEFRDEDPPVTDFMTEGEILEMFEEFDIERAVQDHYRALPIARSGFKALIYRLAFRRAYNLLPLLIAKKLAYKYSVVGVKR